MTGITAEWNTQLCICYIQDLFLNFCGILGLFQNLLETNLIKKRTSHGMVLGEGGIKMSKSKGNVINPDAVIKQYGADTLRVYEMFMGPFEQMIPWDTKGVVGMQKIY